ncbi:MAG TPA: hypothetical protein VEJ36_05525 [Nitrososphaerales archaeon]|nr:hypothetical protein [Nitrososphaerales archaeon]
MNSVNPSTLRTVRLSPLVRIAIPPIFVASLPKNAIGFSFEGGKPGAVTGAAILASACLLGALLYGVAGLAGLVLPAWLLGTTGVAMLYTSARGLAFVKPYCSRCRLLPLIKEHEAAHLSGATGDEEIWEGARAEHAAVRQSLIGDPAICSFCPIPKRLEEH